MDRETLIRAVVAGALVIAIMWGFKYVEPYIGVLTGRPAPTQAPPAEKAPAAKPPAEKAGPAAAAPPEKAGPVAVAPPAPPAVRAPALQVVGAAEESAARTITLGSDTCETGYDLKAVISPRGGAVRQLALARRDYFKTVVDRREPPDERAPMDLVAPDGPLSAFTIPELRLRLKGAEEWAKLDLSQAVWRAVETQGKDATAVLEVDIQDDAGKTLLTVRKTFAVYPRSVPTDAGPSALWSAPPQYEIHLGVEFLAADDRVEKLTYALQGPPALPAEGGAFRGGTGVSAVAGHWVQGQVQVGPVAGKDLKKGEPLPATQSLAGADLAWAGQMDKYFAVVMIPQKPSAEGTFAAAAEATWYSVTHGDQESAMPGVRVVSKELALAPGKPVATGFIVYAGPKDPDLLEKYYAALGLDKLIVWAMPCCFLPLPGIEYLSRFLAIVLDAFDRLVRNYGLAIILLVVVLRVVLHPVTRWSTKSMLEMQKLAPKMQEIKEKFADDKERMQQEMAKIGGFKAFGGCLPMFLQMPIWIALYGALGAAIHLRHAYFLPPEWLPAGSIFSMFLQDLSAPDMLLVWKAPLFIPGREIPLIGTWVLGGIQNMLAGGPGGITSFNLLPVLVGLSMYLQQKMTPQPAAADSNPQMAQQRKMMNLMSIFFALMLYSLPSGLCLYISASSFLGFFEQRYLKKKMAPPEAGGQPPKEGPKAPLPPAKEKSYVAGRAKSIAERIEAWMKQRTADSQRSDAEKARKGKRR